MASAVPMTLSSASDLIDLSIQKIVQKSTNLSNLNVHETLFNSQKTEDYYEKDSSMSGFSEASRLTEGAQIASESPVQGFDKTYTQEFFGNMAVFTQHEWKFGIKKRRLESVVKDLIGSLQRKLFQVCCWWRWCGSHKQRSHTRRRWCFLEQRRVRWLNLQHGLCT